jgi:hypothetical protein
VFNLSFLIDENIDFVRTFLQCLRGRKLRKEFKTSESALESVQGVHWKTFSKVGTNRQMLD